MKQFVPPLAASKQEAEVKPKTLQIERKCAFDPWCQRLASDCGGWTRKGCRYFGDNGSKKKTMNKPKAIESNSSKYRDCAWWPFCSESVDRCHGYMKKLCKVYGEGGLLTAPDMDTEEVKQARIKRRKIQQEISRKRKKIDI